MGVQWYVTRDGKEKHGPFGADKLRELADFGKLQPTDMVFTDGSTAWLPASTLAGVFQTPVLAVPVKVPTPPPSDHSRSPLMSFLACFWLAIGLITISFTSLLFFVFLTSRLDHGGGSESSAMYICTGLLFSAFAFSLAVLLERVNRIPS